MEILNLIRNTLFSPNKLFTTILGIPLTFIDAYVGFLLFSTVLDISYTNKQKWAYILILSTITFISRNFIWDPLGMLISMIAWPICVILIFKTSILKGFFAEIIPLAISLILETIFEKAFLIFTAHPISTLFNIPIYRACITLLIYSIIYFLYKIVKKYHFSILVFDHMNKKYKKFLLAITLLAFFILVSQFYILNCYSDMLPMVMTFLNIFILLAYFTVTIVSFFNICKLESTSMSLEESQLSYKTLELLYDNTRAFKHDFGNILDGFRRICRYR